MKRIISLKKRRKFLKVFKGIFVCLIFVVGVFGIRMVDALINDSKMEKNRVQGIYPITKLNGVDRIFYLNMYTMNDITAYCIELGVDMNTDIYNSTYDFSYSKLPSNKINYIRNLSYFGYGYKNHTDYRYYMATQELIWEYLSGVNVEWSTELKVDGDRIDIETYKQDILKLVAGFNRGLDLRGYEEYRDITIGSRFTITDVNDNLKYYDVISGEHMKVDVRGKYFNIDVDSDYVGEDRIILKRKKDYGYDGLLYYHEESQKLISNGNINEEIELKFNIYGNDISFLIVDNSGIKSNNQYNFVGIDYQLYDDTGKIGDLEGDEVGKLSFSNLAYGNYCIKQVSTNEFYKLNSDKYCFKFDEDTEVINLEVFPKLNEFIITKLYGSGDNLELEVGAIFDIYNMDGSLYDSVETNVEGNGEIIIPYGEYLVKQRKGKNGYHLVDEFFIDAKSDNEVINYTLLNETILTSLIINSIDIDGKVIKDKNIYYKIKNLSTGEYIDDDGNYEFQNIDGEVYLGSRFSYGEYLIEVINKSDDYVEVEKEIKFVVDGNSKLELIDGDLVLIVDYSYELAKGNVNVSTYAEKFISNDGSYYYDYFLEESKGLNLVADEDIIVNNSIIYNKDEVVLEFDTNNEGKFLISNLYSGKYCILYGEYKKCFEVFKGDIVDVNFKVNVNKGNVVIHNVSNKSDNINNTLFEVYDSDKNLIYTGITNEDGIIKISDLVFGDYCFKQIKVSDDYVSRDDLECFSINKEDIEIEFVNELVEKSIVRIPNTFSNVKNNNLVVFGVLFLLGGFLYKIKIFSFFK